MIKLTCSIILSSVKMEHPSRSCIGNGTFELGNGTAAKSRSTSTGSRALQQRLQPKGNITDVASWISHCV
jgi:hypothetical protein